MFSIDQVHCGAFKKHSLEYLSHFLIDQIPFQNGISPPKYMCLNVGLSATYISSMCPLERRKKLSSIRVLLGDPAFVGNLYAS